MESKIGHHKLKISSGFTLIEVVAALTILSLLLTSVMVVMNRITGSMIDLRSQTQAFTVARQNMEELLSSSSVSDKSDFGILETNPDITWQTVVEPFYEPISKRMWIRGMCSAGYTDSSGQRQTIELSCWLTGLTADQIKQILQQQKQLEKLIEEFSLTEYGQQVAQQHQINLAFLRFKGLDVQEFKDFIEQLERRRIDYIAQYGMDEGYMEFADELTQEEFDFMYRQGADYDELVLFYDNYDPDDPGYASQQLSEEQAAQNSEEGGPEQATGPGEIMDSQDSRPSDEFPDDLFDMPGEN